MGYPPGSANGDQIQLSSEDLVKKMKDSKVFDKLKVKILQNMQTNEALIQIVDDFVRNTNAAKSNNPGRINDEIRSNKTIDDLRPHVLEAIWAEMCLPESDSSHFIDHELLLAMCDMEDEIDAATIAIHPPIDNSNKKQ